jgi:hypothetical protein
MDPDIKETLYNIFADMGFNLLGEEIDNFNTSLNESGLMIVKQFDISDDGDYDIFTPNP